MWKPQWLKIGVLRLVLTKERQSFIIVWATADEVGLEKGKLGALGIYWDGKSQKLWEDEPAASGDGWLWCCLWSCVRVKVNTER